MRIAYLSAGAGSLRCGACAHDYLLISRLRQLAHEVCVVPVYTPVHTDLGDVGVSTGIYLGGISAYLRVRVSGMSGTLKMLRPLLDSTPFLDIVTRRMVSTDPHQLGELTSSVLQGTAGPHAAEIRRLVRKLAEVAPDVVMLTNTMLCPLATAISEALKAPVISGFLGEDCFVMDLPEPHRTQCIALLRQHAASLRAIVCPSHAAAQQASLLLQPQPQQLRVVRAPVDVELYAAPERAPAAIPTIGYLSVIRPVKGLDILLRAVQLVADRYTSPFALLTAGQPLNAKYAREVRKLAQRLPAHVSVEFMGEVSLEDKAAMLRRCDVACFPSRIAETRALAAMEAMASGVPIIAPAHGTFPELLASGGGWLYEPGSVELLARQLVTVLNSADRGRAAGLAAAEHVRKFHDSLQIARDLEAVLQDALLPVCDGASASAQ